MHRPRLTSGILAIAALTVPAALATPTIVVFTRMQPHDLSNDGNVVTGGDLSSLVWERNGAPSVTARPGNSQQDWTFCDADGNVAATTIRNTAGEGGFPATGLIAAVWDDSNPGWLSTGLVPTADDCGTSISSPNEVSADGRYVVGLAWVTSCRGRAFIYDTMTDVITDLGVLGTQSSRANDVSADGSVVVGYDSTPGRRPAVWTNGVEMIIPTDPVTPGGEIHSINDAGTIMVGTSSEFNGHLVRWTLTEGTWVPEDLGTMPALPSWITSPSTLIRSATPSSLSEDGTTIVGIIQYQDPPSAPFNGAFLYTDTLGIVDLRDYMVAQGSADHAAIGAYDIASRVSSDGRSILGWGLVTADWLIDLDGAPCVEPVITSNTADRVQNANTTAIFNAGIVGSVAGITYQWYWNGIPLVDGFTLNGSVAAGAATSQLRISFPTCADQGFYNCTVTNACGSVTTVAGRLTINGCVFGDIGNDGFVAYDDGIILIGCMTGPGGGIFPGCGGADLDSDGDVDLADWTLLTEAMPAF